MDWTACPSCGTRYSAREAACPSCLAPTRPLVLAAARAARAAPKRDVAVIAFHLAMAASVLWTVARHGRPLWALAIAGLELSIAAAGHARSRWEGLLVLLRTSAIAIAAALLLDRINLLFFTIILVHAATVFAAHGSATSGTAFLTRAFSGLRPAGPDQDRAAQVRAEGDVRTMVRVGILVPAVATAVLLASVLGDIARQAR